MWFYNEYLYRHSRPIRYIHVICLFDPLADVIHRPTSVCILLYRTTNKKAYK